MDNDPFRLTTCPYGEASSSTANGMRVSPDNGDKRHRTRNGSRFGSLPVYAVASHKREVRWIKATSH